jgi:ribosomal protein S18 acetylase RimI-like enzyme
MVTFAVNEGIVVRRAVEDDAPGLASFAERTFRETFEADNTPEDMDAYCRAAFSLDAQRQCLTDITIDTLIVEDERPALMAYAQLRPGAPSGVQGPSPLEIWRFYVERTHQGRGIAQRMMSAVVEVAVSRGAQTLWLGVWERNHRAQAFYRKMGFIDVGSHTFVLGADVQTDRLMARPIGRGLSSKFPA